MVMSLTEILSQHRGIEGRGHHHDFQVRAIVALHFKASSETNVAEEMAFVKLIEDDCGNSREIRVIDEFANENALSDETDAGAFGNGILKSNLVADLFAESDVSLVRDATG